MSSSVVADFAERQPQRGTLWGCRAYWQLMVAMAMGASFVVGQAVPWRGLSFCWYDGVFGGVFGGNFDLLSGVRGLHLITGILLGLLLAGSFRPGDDSGGEAAAASVSLVWQRVDVIWIVLFALFDLWQ
ncbi:MAG: cytochrome c oxidase subunit 3 [Synechococcaceae cyanobacterium]